jgi:hypothetical protein
MSGRVQRLGLISTAVLLLAVGSATTASAAVHGPAWQVFSSANTTASPGGTLEYFLNVQDVGDEPTDGSQYELTATLPPNLTGVSIVSEAGEWACSDPVGASTISCTNSEAVKAHARGFEPLVLTAEVGPTATGTVTAHFVVSGGGAGSAETVDPTRITVEPVVYGIDAFDGLVADSSGHVSTQAGAHPDSITTWIDFNRSTNPNPFIGANWPVEPTKDIFVNLPPGFIGNPTITGRACTVPELAQGGVEPRPICPAASQVGVTGVAFNGSFRAGDTTPVFNMVPPPGVPARFGFNIAGSLIFLDAELRSGGDYGLSIDARDISEGLPLVGTKVTFWGVPADPSHDLERACPGNPAPWDNGGFTCPSDAPRLAFLRNPTSCTAPKRTSIRFDSWFHPEEIHEDSFVSHEPPGYPRSPADPTTPWGLPVGTTGCEEVPFEPSIAVRSTDNQADSPTGLEFDLTMPQNDDPESISQADVRTARTTLPAGMTVNPAAADGLVGCSQGEVGLDNAQPPTCPDASKIGTVEIVSPDLEEPLTGSIYQAVQFDDPSHSLLAFYTVAEGSGVTVKLAAHVERDPRTGQLTTVFDDNPQLPFDRYSLRFDGGSRGVLVNPPTCGTATTQAVFTSYARPEEAVERQSSFQITQGPNGSPCPDGPLAFAPKLSGGSASPLAGAATPFLMRLTREDGEQRFSGVSVKPPAGLSAYLKGVPYCSESALASVSSAPGTGAGQLAAPSCPAASQIGTVSAGTGAGPLPFYVDTGKVYLAGPYKGAPLSLAIVVPAVAGPLDLGSVLTRAAVNVDPETARLTVISDPLPQLIEGIPLDVRDLRVSINRDHFALNPTSCDPTTIETALTGSEGATASPSQHYQLGECGALAFKPKLTLRLKGKTKRTGHPALRATLTMPQKGPNADIAKAAVTLPHSEFLAQAHIRTICTRVQYAAGGGGGAECPKGSVYGHARAFTPLLDQPLEGPVYLRSSNHPLPDLVASLGGQIHIDLVGRIDAPNGGIRNTFEAVPDAPVSKFVLTMQGGGKGLLENSTDLCRGTHRATARFDGQNGKLHDLRPRVRADCRGRH